MLVTFIRILIGILFVVSSVSKAIEIENFSFLYQPDKYWTEFRDGLSL